MDPSPSRDRSPSEGVAPDAARFFDAAAVRILEDQAVLSVEGEEARVWLQGQVTQDVSGTRAGDAVYGLVTTARGKVMSDVWIFDRGDERFHLVVPRAVLEPLLLRLESQIVMEDVELGRLDLSVLSVQGPRAAEVTAALPDPAPTWPADRLGVGGRDLLVPPETAPALFDRLAEGAASLGGGAVDDASWELQRQRRAIPRFGLDFDERSYPQEAGLGARALSFLKGCYVGQEVVCTLESRGQLSRRLVSIHLPAGAPVAPGLPLTSEGAVAGRVTSAAPDPSRDGTVLALAMVRRAFARAGSALDSDAGPARVIQVVGETDPT